MTGCVEGGELVALCANNQLVQFTAQLNGYQAGKQMLIDQRVSLADSSVLQKLEQDLFAVFDRRGQLRFISLEDPEVVKFKTSLESKHETEEVLPLLKHSEQQDLMRDAEFQVLKFEIEALQEFVAANPHQNKPIFNEEQVMDTCLLHVDEGILMHVISQLGHIYSLLIVPQISNHGKVSVVVSQIAAKMASDGALMPLEARLSATQPDKLKVWQRFAPNSRPDGITVQDETFSLALEFSQQTQRFAINFL